MLLMPREEAMLPTRFNLSSFRKDCSSALFRISERSIQASNSTHQKFRLTTWPLQPCPSSKPFWPQKLRYLTMAKN